MSKRTRKLRAGNYVAKIAKVKPVGKKAVRITLEIRPSKRTRASDSVNERERTRSVLRNLLKAL